MVLRFKFCMALVYKNLMRLGIIETNNLAPKWYRQLTNAVIIFIIPAATSLVQSWGFADKTTNKVLLILSFIPAVIKAIGVFMGNGEAIVPATVSKDKVT